MAGTPVGALHLHLSRRESQIMDILIQMKEGTVGDVRVRMPDDPSYNTVRNKLAVLEEKGFVRHRRNGRKYVFTPTTPPGVARRSLTRHLVDTVFAGSAAAAILALLTEEGKRLSRNELEEIKQVIGGLG